MDFSTLDGEIKTIKTTMEALERKVAASEILDLKLEKLEACSAEFGRFYDPKSYEEENRSYSYGYKKPLERVVEECTAMNDAAWKNACEAHERNLPKIETNKKIAEGIKGLFKSLGFSSTKSVEVKGRGRSYPKYANVNAGWFESLMLECKTSDDFASAQSSYTSYKGRIEEYARKRRAEEYAVQQAKEKEVREKEALRQTIAMELKYGEDPMDGILAKDKYLRLAHFLEKNRNDWNDGYHYAECGINGFTVETPEDQEIEDCITSLMGENWNGDGRVFRDCEYNYSYLFSKVDPELLKDYETLKQTEKE